MRLYVPENNIVLKKEINKVGKWEISTHKITSSSDLDVRARIGGTLANKGWESFGSGVGQFVVDRTDEGRNKGLKHQLYWVLF